MGGDLPKACRIVGAISVAERFLTAKEWGDPTRIVTYYRDALARFDATFAEYGDAPHSGLVLQKDLVPVFNASRNLLDWILQTRTIPPRKAKGIEMVARLFEKRLPSNIPPWYAKNRARLPLLIEAAEWPARSSESDVAKVGSFTLHNTVGAPLAQFEEIQKLVAVAERHLSVLDFRKVAYGDVYVVGQIKKSNTLARYSVAEDDVYLRSLAKKGGDDLRYLLHELGHRYWSKFLGVAGKALIYKLYSDLKYAKTPVEIPKVGDRMPFAFPGEKEPSFVVRADSANLYLSKDGTVPDSRVEIASLRKALRIEANFPSTYSAKDEDEFFAECFAFYALGRLKPELRERFETAIQRRVSARFLVAADEPELNLAWVKGVRIWVKKTFAPKTYRSAEEVQAHLVQLKTVEFPKFSDYLLFNRGLLPREKEVEMRSIIDRLRDKVEVELKAAKDILGDTASRVDWQILSATPGTPESRDRPDVRKFYEEKPEGRDEALLRGTADIATTGLKEVEGILSGKLLRFLSTWLEKYSKGEDFISPEVLLEYDVGRMRVVYDSNRKGGRDPRTLAEYIPALKKAKALLERRGFGSLWYGTTFVRCKDCGGVNPHGAQFGVGGRYVSSTDTIAIFSDPKDGIASLMIHELGHRYYYKFMNSGDRARFDSYFGEVAAVSDYGSKATEEDFAEVFEAFVTGRDMSRSQIDRFKAFLADKDRRRLASSPVVLRPAGWRATSDEGFEFLNRLKKPGHFYRGMTNAEYVATAGRRAPIRSTGAYSHVSEGTNFSDDPADAEGYVDFGRDDPRKTGRANYLVEVEKVETMYRDKDGYTKSREPVPFEAVTRIWEMYAEDDAVWIRRVK